MGGGGAERQVVEILKHLDRSRFLPALYLAHRTGELLSEVPSDVSIHSFWEGFAGTVRSKVHFVLGTTFLARWRHLARVLAEEQIDVIYDRTYLATLDAAGATWFRRTPRVSCCVVDPEPELRLHARRSRTLAWRFARSAYSRASLVLANSDGLCERVIQYFQLPPDHVRTFYNLIDFDRIERRAAEFIPDVPREPFLIVTSGRLHAQKGQRFLLEAIRELVRERNRDVRLVVLGQGELEAEFGDFVAVHKLQQHVMLAGFVANPLPWYKHARLFVLPSLYEGLPNALIEAVACGTPVLSTDCPSGPSEILDGGRTGHLAPPGDSRALAEAIIQCMDNYPAWQSLTAAASERVRSAIAMLGSCPCIG
jgi:glycosyltransferase involved in cell wall biosynthesis